MCTNYRPSSRDLIRATLGLDPPAFDVVPEVWPGAMAPIWLPRADVSDEEHGGPLTAQAWMDAQQAGTHADMPRRPPLARWRDAMFGLVPHWASDTKIARHTYNARSETVAEKPSFRTPWRKRQFCLVPMSCFFEPNYESGKAVRWRIQRRDGAAFTVAGIFDTWTIRDPAAVQATPPGSKPRPDPLAPVRKLWSFSMLTINADEHPLMRQFHKPGDEKRSLVVVPPELRAAWLQADPKLAHAMLHDIDPDDFEAMADPLPRRTTKVLTG